MVVEETLRSKFLYKIELYLLKIIPFVLAICYFSNIVLSYFHIEAEWLSHVAGLSFIPFIFLYISSFVFRFCIHHRIPLYYILINHIITIIDYYYQLPVSNLEFLQLHSAIFGVFILLYIYFKLTHESKLKKFSYPSNGTSYSRH